MEILNFPSLSVWVPCFPSGDVMETPSTGAPLSSVTLPVTVRFCAAAFSINTNTADKIKIDFLICLIVYGGKYNSHSL